MTRIEHISSQNTNFVNNFWGQKDSGCSVIQGRIKDALGTLQELLDYYQERIQIEKEYTKKLDKLNSKILLGSHETGSLKKSLDKLSYENQQMIKYNNKFIKSMNQINYEKLHNFYTIYHKKVSKIEHHMLKIISKKRDAYKQLESIKNKYQEECSQIKSLKLSVQTTWGKELDKHQAKLNKLNSSNPTTKKNYQIALTSYKELNEIFIRDWSIALRDFYKLEIERIQICKVNCFNFCNNIATLCVDNDQSVDLARSVFAQIMSSKDLQDFSDTYGTGDRIYKEPQFIDYMNGYDDASKPSEFTLADFENPDYTPILSRSYSSYSAATQELNNNNNTIPNNSKILKRATSRNSSNLLSIANKELPPVKLLPPSPISKTLSPTRKPPAPIISGPTKTVTSNGSIYSSGQEDNKNDVFSIHENELDGNKHKFTNSNGSSNYSNPTNYSTSGCSTNSNGERNWASPRRKEKQLQQFQEQINLKSKELPKFPLQQNVPKLDQQKIPIIKDFSFDFIAKALEDLNSGGDGDLMKYRKSVRRANEQEQRNKSSAIPFKSASDYVDDHNEVATRYESISFNSPMAADIPQSTKQQRPKSMVEPMTNNELMFQEDLVSTCIVDKINSRRSLSKAPSKSYINLHSMIDQNYITPMTRRPYLVKAKARYTYTPQHHGELYFKKGWHMYIIHKQEDNWFLCELGDNCNDSEGLVGLVPGNYIIEGNDLFQ